MTPQGILEVCRKALNPYGTNGIEGASASFEVPNWGTITPFRLMTYHVVPAVADLSLRCRWKGVKPIKEFGIGLRIDGQTIEITLQERDEVTTCGQP